MAADAAVSHMTFFIASIVVAVAISGVIIGISNSIADDIRIKGTNAVDKMGTDIMIINDPTIMPYSDGNLSIYVKNVGDVSLYYNDIVILIDGQYMNYTIQEASQGNYIWNPSKVIRAEVSIDLAPGDHSAKVVMRNGVSDSMLFRI